MMKITQCFLNIRQKRFQVQGYQNELKIKIIKNVSPTLKISRSCNKWRGHRAIPLQNQLKYLSHKTCLLKSLKLLWSHIIIKYMDSQDENIFKDGWPLEESYDYGRQINRQEVQYSIWFPVIPNRNEEILEYEQVDVQTQQAPAEPKLALKGEEKKRNYYPTKNLLPSMKLPHRLFIERMFGNVKLFPQVIKILDQSSITMENYQSLYRHPQLRSHWKKMFQKKTLYRALLLSRAKLPQKKIFVKKINVFEDAYRSQRFKKIN